MDSEKLAETALASGRKEDGGFTHDNYQVLLGRVIAVIEEAYNDGLDAGLSDF